MVHPLAELRDLRRRVEPGTEIDLAAHEVPDLGRLWRTGWHDLGPSPAGRGAHRLRSRVPPPVDDEPLVSVLVKGYRPDFLDEALHSARRQSWTRLEIVVADDCRGDEVRTITEGHAAEDRRIRYVGRPPRPGGPANLAHGLAACGADLVKMLDDDDLLEPTCVEHLVTSLVAHPRATLAVCRYSYCDERSSSRRFQRMRLPEDATVDGATAVADVLRTRLNWLTAPTMSLFRRSDLPPGPPQALVTDPVPAAGDVAMWINLLSRGDVVALVEPLTQYRLHPAQGVRAPGQYDLDRAAWDQMTAEATDLGLSWDLHPELVWQPLRTKPWWPEPVRRAVDAADRLDAAAALELVDRCAAARPDDPDLAVLAAGAAARAGDTARAVGVLRSVVGRAPWNLRAAQALAGLLAEHGKADDALEVLGPAVSALCLAPGAADAVRALDATFQRLAGRPWTD